MRAALLWFLLVFLSFPGFAFAQEKPGRFWTTETQYELAADAGAKAADFYYTMAVASEHSTVCETIPTKGYVCTTQRFVETNPIARPFVTRGRAAAAGYFAGLFAIDTFAAYELHKHGHPKLARALLLFGIADNGGAAAFSAVNR